MNLLCCNFPIKAIYDLFPFLKLIHSIFFLVFLLSCTTTEKCNISSWESLCEVMDYLKIYFDIFWHRSSLVICIPSFYFTKHLHTSISKISKNYYHQTGFLLAKFLGTELIILTIQELIYSFLVTDKWTLFYQIFCGSTLFS